MARGRRRLWVFLAVAAFAAAVSGCGDNGDPTEGQAAPTQGQDDPGTDDGSGGDGGTSQGDCTIGPVAGDDSFCADGLIDELAAIPVPDTVDEFGTGSDLGGRFSQDAYFNAPVADLVSFYEQELPGAGFEVTLSEGGADAHTIEFTDAEGRNGTLLIRTAASHDSQIGYQIFSS